ncbi:MAG: flagellar basal body-associated FliL family protein [Hyphomicrobiales bacterium]|nr:flagellar basal body-associated FliL family protein [Hyphomicrobiales bacterium]
MNDEASAPEEEQLSEEELAEGGAGGKKKKSKKKLLAVLVVLVLLGGGGAGAYFMGLIPGLSSSMHSDKQVGIPNIIYYDLAEFLVNLNTSNRASSFLKMSITLELPNDRAKALVEAKLPRIRDTFQVYLRELRSTDLQGSAGLVRLKEELLLRLNKILETERVTDILFKEIVVQ